GRAWSTRPPPGAGSRFFHLAGAARDRAGRDDHEHRASLSSTGPCDTGAHRRCPARGLHPTRSNSMTARHPFRFGIVAATARTADEWADKARRVESLGYATLVIPDRVQHTLSPPPAPAAAAAATPALRVRPHLPAHHLPHP